MNSKDFLKEGFVEDASDVHMDHEVQMAREECYHAAEHALAIHKLLRNISEQQGLEGWVSSKITLANDYLNTVREHLEYELLQPQTDDLALGMPIAENEQQGVAEGSLNEGQYEMMMRNGQVKKFIAKDDADAKRIAAGHGAKSVIKLKGGVPAGKVAEQGVMKGSLKEFAPGNGGGDGRWYTDDEIADIIGEDWFEFDLSGEAANISRHGEHAKILLVQEAQAYFEDRGYHGVMVQDVRDDEDYLSWYISGNFTRLGEGVAEGMKGQVVFSGSGADGGKYEIIQTGPTDFMIHANGKHIDTYSSLQRAMGVLKNEVSKLKKDVAEGFPYDVDHMPGKTTKHTSSNCTTCHGRKSMYKVGGKLFPDNKQGATKVKCPTCKGTGDKQGVAEGLAPGQAAWKKEMTVKGAVSFKRDQHGGGTVDRIVAYDKDGKVVGGFNRKGVAEGAKCNHTMEGKNCPVHGLKECPMSKAQALAEWRKAERAKRQTDTVNETTAGSVAGVVNAPIKNKAKVGSLFGGTYKQPKKAKKV